MSFQRSHFCAIPVELQFQVITHLRSKRDLANISLVSRSFYELGQDNLIWKSLAQQRTSISNFSHVNPVFDWKLYFREKECIETRLTWTSGTQEHHPPPRQSHGAAAVGKKVVIIGGHTVKNDGFDRKNDIWAYDTEEDKFEEISTVGDTPPALSRHRMVTVGGDIYSFGGILQDKTKLNHIYRFTLATREWKRLTVHGTPPEPRCDPVVVSHGKKLVIYGGSLKDLVFPSDVHVFDTETCTWSQPVISGTPPPLRIGAVGTVLHNKLYIYGGGDYDKDKKEYTKLFDDIWTLDLETWTWDKEPVSEGLRPNISDFLNAFTVGNHIIIEGGWCTPPFSYDTISRSWTKMQHEKAVNNNDSSCTQIGDAVYYYGGYFNVYKHHLVKLDMSHLSFLSASC